MRCWHDDSRILRGALLAASIGLAQCHDDGNGGCGDCGTDIAIVPAFPQLTFGSPIFFAQAPCVGEDLAGELYLTAFDGRIYKLAPSD